MMFGLHWPELVIVLVLAVVVFGPKRLPEIGGSLGKTIKSFRKEHEVSDEPGGATEIPHHVD